MKFKRGDICELRIPKTGRDALCYWNNPKWDGAILLILRVSSIDDDTRYEYVPIVSNVSNRPRYFKQNSRIARNLKKIGEGQLD